MAAKQVDAVTVGDRRAWRLPYSLRTTARVLTQLLTHNHRAIARTVLPALGIDIATRKVKKTLIHHPPPDESALSAHECLSINKGLAMELLVSFTLTGMDDPSEVRSWCVVGDRGDPKHFAPPGFEDILASYGTDFRIVAEVSAKRRVKAEDFQDQIDKGIRHAVKRNEADGEMPTYVLVITGASVEKERSYREVYNASWRHARDQGGLKLIPISGPDWAELVSQLCEPTRNVGLDFDRATFTAALDRIYDRLTTDDSGIGMGWTRDTLLGVLDGDPELLPTPDPKPPTPGPKRRTPRASKP